MPFYTFTLFSFVHSTFIQVLKLLISYKHKKDSWKTLNSCLNTFLLIFPPFSEHEKYTDGKPSSRESAYQSIESHEPGLLKRNKGGNVNLEMPCIFAFLLNQSQHPLAGIPSAAQESYGQANEAQKLPEGRSPAFCGWIEFILSSFFFPFDFFSRAVPLPFFHQTCFQVYGVARIICCCALNCHLINIVCLSCF